MPDSIGDNRNHDVSGMTSKNAPAVPRRIRHVSLLEDVLTSLKFQDCFARPYLDDKGFGIEPVIGCIAHRSLLCSDERVRLAL
jgi:hypothetical protein